MRRLLLDTHAFIWALIDSSSLGEQAKALIESPNNEIYISAASVWEAGIKTALGKWNTPEDLDEAITAMGCKGLSISPFHGKQAALLPPHHSDPFDRILIAQAQAEGLTLVSADSVFPKYGIALIDAKK